MSTRLGRRGHYLWIAEPSSRTEPIREFCQVREAILVFDAFVEFADNLARSGGRATCSPPCPQSRSAVAHALVLVRQPVWYVSRATCEYGAGLTTARTASC